MPRVLCSWLCAAVLIVLWCAVAVAQPAERRTKIASVQVGAEVLSKQEWEALVIASEDTLTVSYGVLAPNHTDPILFSIALAGQGKGERKSTVNTPTVRWCLEQGRYSFVVMGYSRTAGWEATPDTLVFEVDDVRGRRRKQDRAALQAAKDTSAAAQQQQGTSQTVTFALAALGGIIALVAVRKALAARKAPYSESAEHHDSPEPAAQTEETVQLQDISPIAMSEIQQLKEENARLSAEIEGLRGQIASLEKRSDELKVTNKELERQKERLVEHEKSLLDLQRQKDELFSLLVNDMKNPASLVKGLVELLRSYDLTAGEQQDVMNDLMTTSSKIFQMAQEISKIVVVESGNLTLSTEPTDIRPILSQVIDRAAGKAGRKSLRVVDTTVNAVPPVLIDTGKIEEVIDTLVDNAIRVSPNGSIVEVRAWKKDSHLVVEVKDQGPGMSADDVRKAFAQTSSSSSSATLTNESAMPSGLTLWFVKRIVEGHKGKVWVRSAVGRGATFAFELPLA